MMRVALDVESVLAEPNAAVARSTDRLTLEQIRDTWFTDGKDEPTYQIYMGVSDAIWRHKPEVIQEEEPDISGHVEKIYAHADVLDIVTHRQHVDEQVVWWLQEHGIEYDDFVSCSRPKQELDYDIYIDDSPNMFGECRLLLRHQPWNASLDDFSSESCDRINSLAEVPDFL
jgi:hypothetical protein